MWFGFSDEGNADLCAADLAVDAQAGRAGTSGDVVIGLANHVDDDARADGEHLLETWTLLDKLSTEMK